MSFSPAARHWLHAMRSDETKRKVRRVWAAAAQYEKGRRIFDCTSKGTTEEQAIREYSETCNYTTNVMQTKILGVKNQLTKRGRENLERITMECIQRDDATRRRMQEEQQDTPMDVEVEAQPRSPLSHFPEGSRVAWILAQTRAKRALTVDVIPDDEMDSSAGRSSDDVEGQIPTRQTITDDEDEPENSGGEGRLHNAKGRHPKRQASEPAGFDKNKRQKKVKEYICGRCTERMPMDQLDTFGTTPRKFACKDRAACARRKDEYEAATKMDKKGNRSRVTRTGVEAQM